MSDLCVGDIRQWVEWLDACGVIDGTMVEPDEIGQTFPVAARE